MNSDKLVFIEKKTGVRATGVILLPIGFFIIMISWFVPNFFGTAETESRMIITIISLIFGLLIFLFGCFMAIKKDTSMIFDSANKKIFYTEKGLFNKQKNEYFFNEIYNISRERFSNENTEYYENYLVLVNGQKLRIPTQNETDKGFQDRQIQQITAFIQQ